MEGAEWGVIVSACSRPPAVEDGVAVSIAAAWRVDDSLDFLPPNSKACFAEAVDADDLCINKCSSFDLSRCRQSTENYVFGRQAQVSSIGQ